MARRSGETDTALLRAFRESVRAKIARELESEAAVAGELRRRVLPAISRGLERARAKGLCRAAWIFGSYAWGEPTGRSDVDILVEGCPDTALLAAVVGRETGTDVHVVDTRDAPDSLRERALAEGVRA